MSKLTCHYPLNSCTFLTSGYAIAKQKHRFFEPEKHYYFFLNKNQQDKHRIQFVCSESIHVTCLIVQIVTLTLIMHWSKIV